MGACFQKEQSNKNEKPKSIVANSTPTNKDNIKNNDKEKTSITQQLQVIIDDRFKDFEEWEGKQINKYSECNY